MNVPPKESLNPWARLFMSVKPHVKSNFASTDGLVFIAMVLHVHQKHRWFSGGNSYSFGANLAAVQPRQAHVSSTLPFSVIQAEDFGISANLGLRRRFLRINTSLRAWFLSLPSECFHGREHYDFPFSVKDYCETDKAVVVIFLFL